MHHAIDVRTERRGRILLVGVTGEVDLSSTPELQLTLDEKLTTGAPLVLDLDRLGFLGAAGLSMLLDLQRRAVELRTRWAVVAGTGPARRALEVTGIGARLPVRPTVAEAIRTLAEPRHLAAS